MVRKLFISALALTLTLPAALAQGQPRSKQLERDTPSSLPQTLTLGDPFVIPDGWWEFCHSPNGDCPSYGATPATINMTAEARDVFIQISLDVNNKFTYTPAARDQWVIRADSDCKAFVLAYREQAIAKGFPPSALLPAIVIKPDGDGHAVLVIRAKENGTRIDYVLDSDKMHPGLNPLPSIIRYYKWQEIYSGKGVVWNYLRGNNENETVPHLRAFVINNVLEKLPGKFISNYPLKNSL